MFAPRAAKLKAETGSKQKSALQRGTILSRHDDSGVEQADVLQPFSRGGSGHKTESPACAWDFAKMPVSSPGREGQFRSPPSLPKPLLIGSIQPKLKVGAIDDPLEHEADRLADQVMRMPASDPASISPPQISRKCAGCEDEEKLQKKQTRPQTVAGEAPAGVHETLRSAGQPLDSETRAFFEPRFRRDLSQVRIHADTRAAESAESVYARAYTVANHVVFGHGQYAPRTADGRHLLAHELTHTVQQQGSNGALSATAALQRAPGDNPPSSGSTRFFDVSRGPLTKAEKQKLVELREKLGLPVTPTEGDTSIVGILVFETGEELELHSGEFGGYHAGVRRTEGPAGPGSGSTRFNRTHVETFAAQAMRKRGVKRAVLLIEKEPCAVCGGYDKGHPEAETKTPLASKVLPEDAQLLVVDGDYVTYLRHPVCTGKARSETTAVHRSGQEGGTGRPENRRASQDDRPREGREDGAQHQIYTGGQARSETAAVHGSGQKDGTGRPENHRTNQDDRAGYDRQAGDANQGRDAAARHQNKPSRL